MTKVDDNLTLAHGIALAWLSNPNTRASADAVQAFLADTYAAVSKLDVGDAAAASDVEESSASEYAPAVSVRKSLGNGDYLISLITGEQFKTLTRHLNKHGLTPDEYRARYGLKSSYPMTAPNYSKARSDMAKERGLGRKPGTVVAQAAEAVAEPVKAVAKRARKSIADAKRAAQEHLGG
ncbi:transcriptional regulator, MucR family [Sphingomonas palmae]|uniref:Transcriptional regulator, MucR family n=1 Tax=Sphingomonas palmae TaxID=1855283 RepID=A0A1H7MLY5_9SPHN|nr:MucR family transcriptional regulator [Sphingomonas palmae]SEL11627.1 transcriptional regulator, MucR family [Sphingomonas palmae]